MIYDILTISSISYLLYSGVQRGMILHKWLLFWAKWVLRREDISMSDMNEDEILDLSKNINPIMKPLGLCIKCFAVWACLLVIIPYSLFVDYSFLELSKIYVISTTITIWIAAQT